MKRCITPIALLSILIFSCETKTGAVSLCNEIKIGEYVLTFPNDYKLIKEQGMDSYVGRISNGKLNFYFDCGYYSNPLEKSVDEYLSQDVWKWNALASAKLLPSGSDLSEKAKETKMISKKTFDNILYRLVFVCKQDTMSYSVSVPDEIRLVKTEIDTINNVVYKFVSTEEYTGLYAKNLKGFSKSMNAYTALSITVDSLNGIENGNVMRILKTCRLLHD